MYNAHILGAAGWAENAAKSGEDGFSLLSFIGFLAILVAIGVVCDLLIQRVAELSIGRWRTSTRELMVHTSLVAVLCALVEFVRRMHQ